MIKNGNFDGGQPPTPPEPTYKYTKHYFMLDGLGIDFGFIRQRRDQTRTTNTNK